MRSLAAHKTFLHKSVAILLAALTLLAAGTSADEKHIAVYSPVATYSLPVLERGGHEYVGLLELLEPLGRVSSQSNGRSLRLRYNAIDAEFVAGKMQAKIRGRAFDFSIPFLIENSRGLIPLVSAATLLPRFLGTTAMYREGSRRLFVGDVGIQPSFRLDAGSPSRLAISFSAPVNPTISTEPGKLRMVFRRDPVVSPGSQSITFENKQITHAEYSEIEGAAEIDVGANASLMASFSSDRKTIFISAIEVSGNQAGQVANAVPPANPVGSTSQSSSQIPAAAQPSPNMATANPPPHRMVAVVDPGHGGDERGAAFVETLAEKDVTLGFSRLLRHELEMRGFAVLLLRDADSTIALDPRAAAANTARAGIYISLHATSQGSMSRVYTALLPVASQSKGSFHAWNSAQASALPVSRIVATAIASEMKKRTSRRG